MKDTGPDAVAPVLIAGKPPGLKGEKSRPMPPPCCIQRFQNPVERIDELSGNETIEQRDVLAESGAGQDAATGQKAKTLEDGCEALLPLAWFTLDRRYRTGNPRPRIRDTDVRHPFPVCAPITRGPYQFGDVCRRHISSVRFTASLISPSPGGMK
jgi:hypothetical protein